LTFWLQRPGGTAEYAFCGCHWLCQCQCGFNRKHPVAGHGSTASRAPAAMEVYSSNNGLTTISSRQLFRTFHVVGDSRGDTRSNECSLLLRRDCGRSRLPPAKIENNISPAALERSSSNKHWQSQWHPKPPVPPSRRVARGDVQCCSTCIV
jgi:hypothetical protein